MLEQTARLIAEITHAIDSQMGTLTGDIISGVRIVYSNLQQNFNFVVVSFADWIASPEVTPYIDSETNDKIAELRTLLINKAQGREVA